MKIYRVILSSAILLSLVSCQDDSIFKFGKDSNEMGDIFVESTEDATRCESHGERTLFNDMPYVTSSGDTLYITATVSDMGETVVEQKTKGAPITSATSIPGNKFYTNVYRNSGLYQSVHNTPTGEDYDMSNVAVNYASSKWSFDKTYFWPKDDASEELHFVSLGPANLVDDSYIYNLSASGYGWNTSGYTLKGRFQSRKDDIVTKNDAVNLYDFVYGYDNQSKNTHSGSVSISLKHACVGVRFIVGDIFGTIGTISLTNFYRNADFTISSSGLSWSNWGNLSEFKQEFNKVVDNSNKDSGEALDETTGGTKTFMLIPQQLHEDASMIIDIANTLHPDELSFDKIIEANPSLSRDWREYQGKIITFKVSSEKANTVSVAFNDTVAGCVKSGLQFTNDGKSAIYIRACLVGNWLNKDDKVLTSWSETATNRHGIFKSTPGNYFPDNVPTTAAAATSAGIGWVKGADGFYYYTKILESCHTATQPLFDSFEVTSKPADNEGNWNTTGSSDESMKITSFEMAILVQAVAAEVSGTGTITKEYAKAAWGNAVENYLTTTSE